MSQNHTASNTKHWQQEFKKKALFQDIKTPIQLAVDNNQSGRKFFQKQPFQNYK